MKIFFRSSLVAALLFIGAGCVAAPAVPQPSPAPAPVNAPPLGGDRDAHGCIGSAGYSWCEAKAKCLRPWEEKCEGPSAVAPTTVMVSAAETTKYCNGADMDSDGYRKTITVERPFTPAAAGASDADRIRAVLAASTSGMCKTVMTKLDVAIKDGVARIPPIDGWAGVSITMCSCKPQVEVNLLRLPGITGVVWE